MSDAPAYPRPQLVRPEWTCLDGPWDFSLDPPAQWTEPDEVAWTTTIQVPFAPETPASGIAAPGFYTACWYRRTFDAPALRPGDHLLLHFSAVDYAATVWVNGTLATQHEGGYTPFAVDVTRLLAPRGPQTVVVRAYDDPSDLAKPRGKQDWQAQPHSIWYPRTTGIWQTVWLERVPSTWIANLQWTPDLDCWGLGLEAHLAGAPTDGLRLRVKLCVGDAVLADDSYSVWGGEVARTIALTDPGIDDFRNALLWRPSHPTLLDAELELQAPNGEPLDRVRSYTALRAVGTQGDRFLLNGRLYPLRLVLDQGYWPESGATPPDDAALRRDVELVKAMGFNGVRKHQMIPPPRYLYWADRLGLLVWEEMPSAYRFTKQSIDRLTHEWLAVLDRDLSHPCVVTWVPFNESWGVPNLPTIAAQRDYVQAIYHLTKTVDSTRPVVGNDGWESGATDIIGIHDYDPDPERMAERYRTEEVMPRLFRRERPGGRLLTLEGHPHAGQPLVLSEFGGIAYSDDRGGTWGYSRVGSAEELANKYEALLKAVGALSLLAGFCYTQFADTYQEANGLLYADRTPKFPLERMAHATRGALSRPHLSFDEA